MILDDNGSAFTNWTAGERGATWNISANQFHSSPTSFTESPSGNYPANCDLNMTLTAPLNVSANPVVTLSFWHRYTTEVNYDYCKVEVSNDGGLNWRLVTQYHGTLSTWTQQTFDISSYANGSSNLKVRFRLTSDAGLQYDGWYVDDIVISTYCVGLITSTGINTEIPNRFALEQNYPNPFNPETLIKYEIPVRSQVKLTVYDVLGKTALILVNEAKDAGSYEVKFDAGNLASGLYFYKIEAGNFTDVKKMILIK